MPKLNSDEKFIDVSDYGRPIATAVALRLKNSSATPVHITILFGISGLVAAAFILYEQYAAAGFFLILKSIIDAIDGELARVKERPSYTGRYLDSIFDYLLNFILIAVLWYVTNSSLTAAILAFISIQLQGTLYNYYYVILRHHSKNGDKTSNIFETETPEAYPQENQATVNRLFLIYRGFYSLFDWCIYKLDRNASEGAPFPSWFMSMLSIYGLGFQLLLMAIFLTVGWIHYIIPFFIGYSVLVGFFIAIRKVVFTPEYSQNRLG
ncbi:MAG: CDP-alcohol phosphatidyltransferase family protein [Balneolaceae bacterium]